MAHIEDVLMANKLYPERASREVGIEMIEMWQRNTHRMYALQAEVSRLEEEVSFYKNCACGQNTDRTRASLDGPQT